MKKFGISYDWLNKIFPFYLLISDENKVLDKGPGFSWLDVKFELDDYISDTFTPFYFFKELTYDFIKNDSDEEVVFKDHQNSITIKGKAYFFSDVNSMLLLTSISIHNPDITNKIQSKNFEPYNQTLDMFFLKAMQEAESKKSLNLIRKLEKRARDLVEENKKISSGRVFVNGEKIKQIRQSKLMSVDNFVNQSINRKCPLSLSTIKRAEAGAKVYFKTALDIANVLDVNIQEILQ
ncbi:hypothetical protein PQO03_12080 [Lentisphaera profundi]|uniref:HTH cro/C1-type domain-containing protein n=1 Tax=Lentisphaera profundi TaxID=1658616 RepID=A0ABY7W0C8_9BACT|nr:hypothetical protein [Lentisphaera profundi]WDE98577.1 hypothetical protein PQO03_12080 [Lentisphaera profundi]